MSEEQVKEAFMQAMRAFSWKTLHDEAAITKAHDAVFAYVQELENDVKEAFDAGWRRANYYRDTFKHHTDEDCKEAWEDWNTTL